MHVEFIDDRSELEQRHEAWEALAQQAIEPNPFASPSFVLPALSHLKSEASRPAMLFVWSRASGPRDLLAAFPTSHTTRSRRLPLASYGSWSTRHTLIGTPLVVPDALEPAIDTLLDWASRDLPRAGVLRLEALYADGPVTQQLLRALQERGTEAHIYARLDRPFYRRKGSFDEWIARVVSGRRRARFRRSLRQLEEGGKLEFIDASDDKEILRWIDAYLRLEELGWKGAQGQSFTSRSSDVAFFRDMCERFAAEGKIWILALCLDGVPIAMRISILQGQGSFAFKTSYDPRFSHYSPGVLLEIELLRRLLEGNGISWMDSCTSLSSSPLHWLWTEQRRVYSLLIPCKGVLRRGLLRTVSLVEGLVRRPATGDRT